MRSLLVGASYMIRRTAGLLAFAMSDYLGTSAGLMLRAAVAIHPDASWPEAVNTVERVMYGGQEVTIERGVVEDEL
jgi:hypothetical protein